MRFSSKQISNFLVSVSSTLLIYIFYKERIVTDGNMFSYYKIYYLISIFLLILSLISYFFSKNLKANVLLLGTSTLFAIYLVEFFLVILFNLETISRKNYIKENLPQYDQRTKKEFLLDLRKKNPNATVSVGGSIFIKDYDLNLYPLSGISNTETVFCNENGYFAVYKSDRYGFKNPDEVWDKTENIDTVFIGDSFTQGACVNMEDDIAGNYRKFLKENKIDEKVINLGIRGQGPLIEYAILREYLPLVKSKKVILIFFENDLYNLIDENRNQFLRKYLLEDNFSQNLAEKNNLKDDVVSNKLETFIDSNDATEKSRLNMSYHIKELIKLKKLRGRFLKGSPKVDENYVNLLKKINSLVEDNSSKLYFVYLPSHRNYRKSLFEKVLWNFKGRKEGHSFNIVHDIKKTVESLRIPFIDLHKEIFENLEDPKSVAPVGGTGHFNEYGYNLVSKKIFEKIAEIEKNQ